MLKKIVNNYLDKLAVLLVKTYQKNNNYFYNSLVKKSHEEALEYIKNIDINKIHISNNNLKLLEFAFYNSSFKDGLNIELGVFKGETINFLSSKFENKFYGFDSFVGLQQNWLGHSGLVNSFNLKGIKPKVNKNCVLIKGFVEDTLPEFKKKFTNYKINFLHIDLDLYDPVLFSLDCLKEMIVPGTIIVFDEYLGFPGWRVGEYGAFQKFVNDNNISYDYIGFSGSKTNVQSAVVIK